MQAFETLTAERILAIPRDEPERLFGADPKAITPAYRTLAKRWHPGAVGGEPVPEARREAVFERIAELVAAGRARAAAGGWRTPGLERWTGLDGRVREFRFRARRAFELGETLIGRTAIAFVVRPDVADLAAGGRAAMARLAGVLASDPRVADGFGRRLPRVVAAFETPQGAVTVVAKEADEVLLADLIARVGSLDPRHAAWLVSDLMAIASLLETRAPEARLVNPAIGPGTLLVSPAGHSTRLVGGWWYAAPAGSRLAGAPERTHASVPPSILKGGEASVAIMLDLVRLTALEAMGHRGPTTALGDPGIPPAFSRWLASPPAATAIEDYAGWERARAAAFGPPRFVEFAVRTDDVYPPL